jgi:hypothetical protein
MGEGCDVMTVSGSEWYVSYLVYSGQGEGSVFLMVVAGDAAYAERMLRGKVDEYFYSGIVTKRLGDDLIDEATGWRMVDLVPGKIREVLGNLPSWAGHYLCEFEFNAS